MTKRLTFTDYVYSLLFIFLLVCMVGAFFYGVQIGKKQTAAKYEKLITEIRGEEHLLDGYHQQYLVSFYHTVFLPYREFQKKWFAAMNEIESGTHSRSGASLMRDIADLANEKHAQISRVAMPESAPLLVEAQTNFLQSLKLFASAADQTDLRGSGQALLDSINGSAYYQEAKSFGLQGIRKFYSSIIQWNQSVEPLPARSLIGRQDISLAEWQELNLNLKNEYIAAWMAENGQFAEFYPQDLVLRIDEIIVAGQAGRMNLDKIGAIAAVLVDTRAVRSGDFIAGKSKYYEAERLPQLPFFFAEP
jgi:hypothetical protein